MLENVLFFNNIPKTAVSVKRSVIIHQCWNFALLFSNFCWWRCKV